MPSLELTSKLHRVFEFAGAQLEKLVSNHPDAFPMYTERGRWKFGGETWTNWCEGFLGGELWLLYRHTGDSHWLEKAKRYSLLIEPRKTDQAVHDLGFLFWPTWKRWFDISWDESIRQVVIEAGKTMGLRYQPAGNYLRSFLAPESLFIDIMMNVGIVFYAAQETGDMELGEKALQHCLTTRRTLVRGDGSTAHEGIFDTNTGEFLHQSTQQGWRPDSSWARGLTWALYGFGTAYQFTHDARFLETADACARFYLERTPAHGIPPNDWDEPAPAYLYDSSAAAVAAGGLLNLSRLTGDRKKALYYQTAVENILATLCSSEFLAINTPGWEGLLKHGIYHLKKGLGVDESVMWGDYFFLETVFAVLHGE